MNVKNSTRFRLRLLAGILAAFPAPSLFAEQRTFDLSAATIAEIQAAMDAGALTSERLVQLYLQRIEAYDKNGPRLNAVLQIH